MPEWTLDTEDFAALWYSDANDRFPRPLNYRSRFAFREDFTAHRDVVRGQYSADEFEELELALRTLSSSDMRFEILGGTRKHKNSNGTDPREYHIVGARNPYHCVVLFQAVLGKDNGPIRLRMSRAENLPSYLVKSIPACKPGTHRPATFHPDDLRGPNNSHFETVGRSTPREQYRRLLGRPSDGGGAAGFLVAPLYARPEPSNTMQWYDIIDDGRYTELRGQHISVRPTTPDDITSQFTIWIERALQRLREAEQDQW
ncbi:ESX secretion-associated protein EspG [Nocardia sp. NBC_00565]|uniref:ESX secretion-associated protein EspG n=1 Tax=Nocardia sp. NBC_00565 TaxID=2975993 RepID=UPI002E80D389|nr:ESX secretion-associated protein EspG [Nocardia sp. NBC_00565]WUC04119.1 ESX secretion-associated protein EspG [Nocardia sp. NBC_00565]